MGLKDTVAAAVGAAFNAVGDLKTESVYLSRTQAYSTSTGLVVNTDVAATVQAILIPPGPIRKSIMKNVDTISVDENETRAMVNATELVGITPKIGDRVQIDSVEWLVNEISWDPSGSLYIFKVKRP